MTKALSLKSNPPLKTAKAQSRTNFFVELLLVKFLFLIERVALRVAIQNFLEKVGLR